MQLVVTWDYAKTVALILPPYFLTRPDWVPTPQQEQDLAAWLTREVQPGGNRLITAPAGVAAWQALAWLGETGQVLLHGTGDPAIRAFEPRQPIDAGAFGSQNAVYAASDGVWAMFYAVIDRTNHATTIVNGAFVVGLGEEQTGPYYFFSVSEEALVKHPFRIGWVYLLPRAGFVQERARDWNGIPVQTGHWASLQMVTPLARVMVRPDDFPFLTSIRPHDEATLHERIRTNPNGFPWAEL